MHTWQCHGRGGTMSLYVIAAISVIVCHLSPDFASLKYSMSRLRISNKNIGEYWAETAVMGPSGWCIRNVFSIDIPNWEKVVNMETLVETISNIRLYIITIITATYERFVPLHSLHRLRSLRWEHKDPPPHPSAHKSQQWSPQSNFVNRSLNELIRINEL